MAKKIKTAICFETPQQESEFHTKEFYLRGYSLSDYLNKASSEEVFWLFFKKSRPTNAQKKLFGQLLQLCASISPRSASSHAAMSAGVSHSPTTAILVAALSANAGGEGGAREVYQCVDNWIAFKKSNFGQLPLFMEIWKLLRKMSELNPYFEP